MKLGEICFLTNDVPRLASFYRQLLGMEDDCSDPVHQTLIAEETMLTIYNDGTEKNNQNQNLCVAFTVENIEEAHKKVLALGAEILEPPTRRPWGAVNMSFRDPDKNVIYLRCFPNA